MVKLKYLPVFELTWSEDVRYCQVIGQVILRVRFMLVLKTIIPGRDCPRVEPLSVYTSWSAAVVSIQGAVIKIDSR